MLAAFLIAASILPPPDGLVRESCDLIEVNHYYDHNGVPVFTQAIFWNWQSDHYIVRDWRMVKSDKQLPQRDHATGGYVVTWQDGEVTRTIHSANVRETWTQWDVEVAERESLPVERRERLRGR